MAEHTSKQTSSRDAQPDASTPPSASSTGELTAEEDLAINPPAPTHVHVVRADSTRVVIAWDPPPPVTVPHHYSDHVVAYRIYRRADDEVEFRPLSTTSGTTFTDQTVQPDRGYEYVVSSVREQHAEGSRSDPAAEASTAR